MLVTALNTAENTIFFIFVNEFVNEITWWKIL